MRIDSALLSKTLSETLHKTGDAPLGKIGSLHYSRAQDPAPRTEGGFRKWMLAKLSPLREVALSPQARAESQVCRQTKALSRGVGNLLALMTRPGDQERGVGEVAEQAAVVLERASSLSRKTGRNALDVLDQVLKRHVQELSNPRHGLGDAFAELGSGMMQNPRLADALRERDPALVDGLMKTLTRHLQTNVNGALAKTVFREPLQELCGRMEDKKFLSKQLFLNGTLDKLNDAMGKKIGDIGNADFLALAVKGMSRAERRDLRHNLLEPGALSKSEAFRAVIDTTSQAGDGMPGSTQPWRERSIAVLQALESALLAST
ncbi:hypothetical protein ACOTCG_10340 [Achromobacter xylosoxidans]